MTAPKDIRSLELEETIGGSDHTVIGMRLNLKELAAPDEYGRRLPGTSKGEMVDLGLWTLWEVERAGQYMEYLWGQLQANC